MLVAGWSKSQVCAEPPSLSQFGSEALRYMVENLLGKLNNFESCPFAMHGLVRSDSIIVDDIPGEHAGGVLNQPFHSGMLDGKLLLNSCLKS